MASDYQPPGSTDPTAQKNLPIPTKKDARDLGRPFEEMMILWTSLTLTINNNVKNFKIFSNHPDFFAFDDLVLSIEYKDGTIAHKAYQLKHSSGNKVTIRKSELEDTKGHFSIGKYYLQSRKISNDFQCCIYTTRNVEQIDEVLNFKYKDGKAEKAITAVLEKEGGFYTFKLLPKHGVDLSTEEHQSYEEFFARFYLQPEQDNLERLEQKCVECYSDRFCGKKENFTLFKDFIHKWCLTEEKYQLDKRFIVGKLVESLLTPSIVTIKSNAAYPKENTTLNAMLKEAILKFDVTVFTSEDVIDQIEWINMKGFEEINKSGLNNFIISENFESMKSGRLKEEAVAKISWYQGQCPLIVTVTESNKELVRHSIGLLAKNEIEYKKLLLIYDTESVQLKKYNDIKWFQNLLDLKIVESGLYEQLIDKFPCLFQGKYCTLQEIVDDDVAKVFTTDCLLKSANGKLSIGGGKEEVPDPYMDRCLHKIFVDFKITEELPESESIIISYNDTSKNEIFLENKSEPLHVFRKTQKQLEWIRSKGSIQAIRPYRSESTIVLEEELTCLRNCQHNINVICADTGMGKSTMLKHFTNNYKVGHWVFYLNARDNKFKANQDLHSFVNSLLTSNDRVEAELVKVLYERKRVVFIWDGFDEIFQEDQRTHTLSLIKQIQELGFRQWISSRCNLKSLLEEELNAFARNIEQFDEEQRNKYIGQRLLGKYEKEEIAEIAESIKKDTALLNATDILGIPLQLYLITELLTLEKTDVVFKQTVTFSRLFECLIKGRLEHYFSKSQLHHDMYQKEMMETMFLEKYKLLGAKICLGTTTNIEFTNSEHGLLRRAIIEPSDPVGLLVKNNDGSKKIHFQHESFGEYLAAMFLSENFKRVPKLQEVYFEERFKNIRFMLDLVWSDGVSEAHTAVLYRDIKSLRKLGKNIFIKDKVGRSSLHISLSWYNIQLQLPKIDPHKPAKLEVNSDQLNISIYLLKQFILNGQKSSVTNPDDIFNMNCFNYARGFLFHIAILSENVEVVKFISETIFRFPQDNTDTPLMFAAFAGNKQIVEYLIDEGANVNSSNSFGNTPLHYASCRGNYEIVKLLVNRCASDVDKKNNMGYRPLHYAAAHGDSKIAKLLVEHNCKINCLSNDGWTPLKIAASKGNSETEKLLMEMGADILLTKKEGGTVQDISSKDRHHQITDCLRKPKAGSDLLKLPDSSIELNQYIARSLSRTFLSLENSGESEIFVISCHGDKNTIKDQMHFGRYVEFHELLSGTCKISRNERVLCLHLNTCSAEDFSTLSRNFPENDCHRLRCADNNLEWIESRGSTKRLLCLTSTSYEPESKILQNAREITLICGHPGSGKTTFLKSLKNSLNLNNYLPLYLNSKESAWSISQDQDIKAFILSFMKKSKEFHLEEAFVESLLGEKKIIVLWDAIDEIPESQKSTVYKFILNIKNNGIRQWITARPNIELELESEFNTFARHFKDFSEDEQKSFIKVRIEQKFSEDDVNTVVVKVIENVKSLKSRCTIGIPKQLNVFAELLLRDSNFRRIFPLTATKLCDYIINERFENWWVQNKSKEELSTKKEFKDELFKLYQLLGARNTLEGTANYIFEKNEEQLLENAKGDWDPISLLILANEGSSVRDIFSDYFTAVFLSRHHRIAHFRGVYFNEKFKHIRFLFDLILCEDCATHSAVLCKDFEHLEKNKEDVLTKDFAGRTAVHIALHWCKVDLILPQADALTSNIRKDDFENNSKLIRIILECMRTKHTASAFSEVDELFHMNCFHYTEGYIWHLAVLSEDLNIVKFIFNNSSKWSNKAKFSPLMYAAFMGHFEIAEYLITRKDINVEINAFDENGNSVLHYSVSGRISLQLVQLLINTGANVSARNVSAGNTALHIAAWNNQIEVAKLLLNNKAQVNCLNKDKETPLMFAAKKGYSKLVKFLIDNQAEVNLPMNDGSTALHVAVLYNQIEVANLLIKHNGQVNCSNENGWTPLMYAVWKRNLKITKFLIDKEADVNLCDTDGGTALHVAADNNQVEVAKLLIQNNAQVNCISKASWLNGTPLTCAADKGYLEMAKFLIENKATVNMVDIKFGDAPLHKAVKNKDFDLVKLLVENGSDINARNKDKKTALKLPTITEEISAYLNSKNLTGTLQ